MACACSRSRACAEFKKPLEVGANFIARTAHAALALLDQVGRGRVRLGWTPGSVRGRDAIEVYPAATLLSRGWYRDGYKKKGVVGERARGQIVEAMKSEMTVLAKAEKRMVTSDHLLDAALCVLAASDYARDHDVVKPTDQALAEREGWIWVKRPNPG
jgi:hypothetical protein